jgi:3,4-dihydroxy 2-butanone 4-phosphate synthase/GTP cyclohydrolase II
MGDERVEKAIEAIRAGKMVVVVDDETRENEGDLIMAASLMTPESMAFMIRYTGGVVCAALEASRLTALGLPLMVEENSEKHATAFTISVDAAENTTTGISAADRCATVQALASSATRPEDLRRPGHVFPLRYCPGGVLKRAGHTEAAVDLCVLAGLPPVGVLSELMHDDGTLRRLPALQQFAEEHDLPIISIAELVKYRRRRDNLVTCVGQAQLPTAYGVFTVYVYRSHLDGMEHLALVAGDVRGASDVLVRVHSECLTGDILASLRCDCGTQLQQALKMINEEGCGVLVYLRGHEGRGIGLGHKVRAYALQDRGHDTVEANLELGFAVDSREYGIGAQILADLGITTLRLLTNNPAKYGGLEGYDLTITRRIPLPPQATPENRHYLLTKKLKMGHLIDL